MQEPLNRVSPELIGEGRNNQKPEADSNQKAQRHKLVGQNPGDHVGGVQGVQGVREVQGEGVRSQNPGSGDAGLWQRAGTSANRDTVVGAFLLVLGHFLTRRLLTLGFWLL